MCYFIYMGFGRNMKTITFAIQKGGTGKTSVSVSIAGELALAGKKNAAR